MFILIAYDVSTKTPEGERRLRRAAQVCKDFGQRVQKSVFECSVNQMQYEELRRQLLNCIDEKEDSLRFYRLTEPKEHYVRVYGVNRFVDFEAPLVM